MVPVIHALGQVVFSKLFAGFFCKPASEEASFWNDGHANRLVAVCGVWSEHWQADLPLLQPLKKCWQHFRNVRGVLTFVRYCIYLINSFYLIQTLWINVTAVSQNKCFTLHQSIAIMLFSDGLKPGWSLMVSKQFVLWLQDDLIK